MATLVSKSAPPLEGVVHVPGDKSISHRALILAGLATGKSRLFGWSEGEDVQNTRRALAALGVGFDQNDTAWQVIGVGERGFKAPKKPLWFGNSGTGARLMMGVLATRQITTTFDGDESLKSRPMSRVLNPLLEMGVKVHPENQTTLPLTITGSASPSAIAYRPPVASAQVKSAILLAALNTSGETSVVEEIQTRDHTEVMLRSFGVMVQQEVLPGGGVTARLKGPQALTATDITIPGDFSAAAFPIVAALMVRESRVEIKGVGLNPLRTGLLVALAQMGADIKVSREKDQGGEPRGRLMVTHGPLSAIDLDPAMASTMIDEFPVLFVAAAVTEGKSTFRGLAELRVKESDRLAEMATGLKACGIEVEEFDDGLAITGRPGQIPGGAVIEATSDHRIAMAFAILGLAAKKPITIKGAESISTSFPGFAKVMNGLGANFKETF